MFTDCKRKVHKPSTDRANQTLNRLTAPRATFGNEAFASFLGVRTEIEKVSHTHGLVRAAVVCQVAASPLRVLTDELLHLRSALGVQWLGEFQCGQLVGLLQAA